MKKFTQIILISVVFIACTDRHPSGVVNDGIKPFDSNGGLADTPFTHQSSTDTSKWEHKVGTSKRDTFDNQPDR